MYINQDYEKFIPRQTIVLPEGNKSLGNLITAFLDYIKYEDVMSPKTVVKYADCLKWIITYLPHIISPSQITLEDITTIKKRMMERGSGPARVNSVIFALRKFLSFCQTSHKIQTIHPKDIRPMKLPKRQVEFLRPEEIRQLLDSIDVNTMRGLRMRTLMEVLIATGMRISEALSLNRNSIDWENMEAMIIGKGNKQRMICLTPQALGWIRRYLEKRNDDKEPVFIAFGSGTRLTTFDMSKMFKLYTRKAGLKKKVTPHILRHTMATLMLHNGCDIRFIQELLGHSDIETTAKYYLGTDKRSIKEAHSKYLRF